MKKVAVTLMLSGLTLLGFSQSEAIQKDRKSQFGFSIGGFQTLIGPKDTKDDNIEIKNSSGFRLGILMNHKLGKKLSISPKAELGFSSSSINYIQEPGISVSKPLYNTHLEFMSHFVWSSIDLKPNLYVLAGPSIRIPLIKEDEVSITNNYDAGIDVGIGLNKAFTHFNVMPELRLSAGFMNVFENSTLPKTRYSSISLILNFM
ncbi:hypothetical protein N9242_04345 [Vicingaceae bacterium]|nr:hypothetical protein [Vicingaceae bacterium]